MEVEFICFHEELLQGLRGVLHTFKKYITYMYGHVRARLTTVYSFSILYTNLKIVHVCTGSVGGELKTMSHLTGIRQSEMKTRFRALVLATVA
jgi:hypothetical protein